MLSNAHHRDQVISFANVHLRDPALFELIACSFHSRYREQGTETHSSKKFEVHVRGYITSTVAFVFDNVSNKIEEA